AAARAGVRRRLPSPRAGRLRSGRRRPSRALLPVAQPERQRMLDLATADLLPGQAHGQARQARVTAAVPEHVVGTVIGRAARIFRLAVDRAERGPAEASEAARMRLARTEERVADARGWLAGQQYGL